VLFLIITDLSTDPSVLQIVQSENPLVPNFMPPAFALSSVSMLQITLSISRNQCF
jgi:hypothetical protein